MRHFSAGIEMSGDVCLTLCFGYKFRCHHLATKPPAVETIERGGSLKSGNTYSLMTPAAELRFVLSSLLTATTDSNLRYTKPILFCARTSKVSCFGACATRADGNEPYQP